MGLEQYRKKRRFEQTPEPPGEVKKKGENRFVVHKHQATHLHYDFRLEMGGVLRSWAVPKGPPLETGERRLAVQVEDHPVDYISFSGVIPPGEYGAGTVEIWDSGTYLLGKDSADEVAFQLFGEKLKGRYVLVRTKLGKSDKNWLFLRRKD